QLCQRSESIQKIQHLGIDCLRQLLLYPVSGLRQDDHFQIIDNPAHGTLQLSLGSAADDDVLLASNEQGRDGDSCADQVFRDFPVAVKVAVVIDATTKPGL